MMDDRLLDSWISEHLFERVPQVLAVLDRDNRIVRANHRLEDLFGEWRGRHCYDVLKGRSMRCDGCPTAQVFADAQSQTASEVWIGNDGRHGHYVVRQVPIHDQNGDVAYVLKMGTDVTESKHLQREHQILFERVPCYVAVLDRNLRIVRANELLRSTFGDHTGKLCHEVYKNSPKRCPDCPALLSFEDGLVHTSHAAGQRQDGSIAHYVVTTAPLARNNAPSDYVIEILHDVSDVLELKQKLMRERKLLRSLVDHSLDAIVAVEADGRIAVVNPAAERLLGQTAEHLRGSSALELVFPQEFLDILSSGGRTCSLPETALRVGDAEIPIRFAGVALREEGRLIGSAGFLQDLREVKQLEREKLDAERLAAVGQTVAGLAHGVKNILTGLEGGMFILHWGVDEGNVQRIQQGWEMLDRNFNKITHFVREFLSFSKGRTPLVAATDPNRLTEEVVALYREAAREKGVSLSCELGDGVREANLDAEGIHACLANLVSNAIDACLVSERPDGVVVVRTRERDDCLELEVEDNGCGMDSDIARKVFTSFFTTKGTEGTGLGLLVTKKVILEHGGSIDIDTTPGEGSTFRIRLPRARLPQPSAEGTGRKKES